MADRKLSVKLTAINSGLEPALNRIQDTLEEINYELAEMAVAGAGASASLQSLNAETSKLNKRLGGTNREGSNLAQTANALTNITDEATDGLRNLGKGLGKAKKGMSSSSKEGKELSGVLGVLNTVFEGTTVNIGAFNLQLKNLIVTLPIVTGLIGSAVVAVGALFTAIVGVAGLLGAGLAAGFAQDLQDIEENSADVTDTLEAMEEKMSRIKDAIIEATEPLQIQAFQNLADEVGGGLLWALNQFSIQMAESVDLIFRLKDAMADPFVANFNRTLDVLTNSVDRMLPLIRGVSEYLANAIPEFMRFSSVQTMRFAEEIGNLIKSFIKFGKEATKLTITIIKGLAPVLTIGFNILTGLLDTLNKIPDSVSSFIVKAILLAAAFEKLIDWLTESEGLLNGIAELLTSMQDEGSALTDVFENQIDVLGDYNDKLSETEKLLKDIRFGKSSDMSDEFIKERLGVQLEHRQGIDSGNTSGLVSALFGGYGFASAMSPKVPSLGGLIMNKMNMGIFSPGASGSAGLLSRLPTLSGMFSSLGSALVKLASALTGVGGLLIAFAVGLAFFIDSADDTLDIIKELKQQFNIFITTLDLVYNSIKFILLSAIEDALYWINKFGLSIEWLQRQIANAPFIKQAMRVSKFVDKVTDEANRLVEEGNKAAEKANEEKMEGIETGTGKLGIGSSDATSTNSARSDTSAESMRQGDTYVEQNYNVENNVNQDVKDPELNSKQKRILNDMMRQFKQDTRDEATGG